jgi:hypothetical protein
MSDADSAVSTIDSNQLDAFDTPENTKKRQEIYNKAMYVFLFLQVTIHALICFGSAEAKQAMAKEEPPNIGKGKKVDRKVEPLSEDTVYYEDLHAGSSFGAKKP